MHQGAGSRGQTPPCCQGSPESRAPRSRATRSRERSHARPALTSARHRGSTRRSDRGDWPTHAPSRSSREAYPRCIREIELTHALRTEGEKLLARGGRVGEERGDVDRLAVRGEGVETLGALFEKHRRAVEVPSTPVMEADTDLKDAVIQVAHGCGGCAAQPIERFVLLGELLRGEMLDPADGGPPGLVGARGAPRVRAC